MENLKHNKDGVVSIFNPKDFKIIWKDVPDLENYQVSNIGTVRSLNKNKVWVYRKPVKAKTTLGSYLYVVYSKDGFSKQIPIHRLICKGFNGLPPTDGKRYEANHIDGNKHNNLPSNLEWLTHSENMIHALKNGLRNDNIEIEVYDILADETIKYYSIIDFSRQFAISRNEAKTLISRYNKKPYRNRWLFNINHEKIGRINRPHFDRIVAFDYVSGKILYSDDAATMQYFTGVGATTILMRCGKKKYKIKNPDQMIAGYIFKLASDKTEFPKHSKETAIISREKYFSRNLKPKKESVFVKDYRKLNIIEYNKLSEACIKEDVKYNTITELMNSSSGLFLHKGKCFKRKSDDRNWPVFSDEQILKSMTRSVTFMPSNY